MRRSLSILQLTWLAAAIFLPAPAFAQSGAASEEERLNYVINWPSGLSLGEGMMRTARLADPAGAREYTLMLDAAIPGIGVRDDYRARASEEFCSIELEKKFEHGKRTGSETSVFDAARGVLVRTTAGGGKSEVPIAACAKDALTFLHFLRREVSQGRLPPAQPVHFGATYQVRISYGGMQHLEVAGERLEADRLTAVFKGPASENTFEIFLGRDLARTPLRITAPFSMGTFSMDLVR